MAVTQQCTTSHAMGTEALLDVLAIRLTLVWLLIAISSKLPVCIFCGPALAQLLVGAVHRAIQLHQGLFDDGLVSADAHYASGASSKRNGSTHCSSAMTHATMQRPDRVRRVEQLIRVEALIIGILTALSCAAGNHCNAHWTVTGVLLVAGLSRGGSLAAAALDAHHVDERVAAHPPLSAGHVQAAGGCHQPCLALRNQRARHITQRGAVPAAKEMLDVGLLCMSSLLWQATKWCQGPPKASRLRRGTNE